MIAGSDEWGGKERMRLDKWLWAARFFKTRSLATRAARAGRIRLNGKHVLKANAQVKPGDVLTFPKAQRILVVRVVALAGRRGPATEAQALYQDLSSPSPRPETRPSPVGARPQGAGRPTKSDRRALDRLRGRR